MNLAGGQSAKTRAQPQLALALSNDQITLLQRAQIGWAKIFSVAPDADDLDARLADLRAAALKRDPDDAPVLIWLPPEQILLRELTLRNRGAAAVQEATRLMAEQTDHDPADLTVAVAPGRAGQPVAVMAALTQTVKEAQDYVASWGFRPGPVSTQTCPEPFLPDGPVFRLPDDPAAQPAGRLPVKKLAVAAGFALAVGGAALWAMQGQTPVPPVPSVPSAPPVPQPTAQATAPSVPTTDPGMPSFALANAEPRGIDPPRPGLPDLALLQIADAPAPARRVQPERAAKAPRPANPRHPDPTRAARLTVPAQSAPAHVGDAAPAPTFGAPAGLARPAPVNRPVAAAIVAALDLIRQEGQAPAPAPDGDATDAVDQDADPQVAALDPDTATQGDTPKPPVARPDVVAEPEDASDLAPREMSDIPLPRPATLLGPVRADADGNAPVQQETEAEEAAVQAKANAEAKAEAKAQAEAEAKAAADALAQATAKAEAKEKAQSESDTARQTAEALAQIKGPARKESPDATADETPEADAETPSVYAALAAPEPSRRPKIFERAITQPKPVASVAAVAIPRSVQSAARQRGLALDQTSLIGILDARDGRQALVRTPDGSFRKVARGDVIDGWRVSSISREALRLTRQGQNRTLLLVTR